MMIALMGETLPVDDGTDMYLAETEYVEAHIRLAYYLIMSMGARDRFPPNFRNVCKESKEQILWGLCTVLSW